MLKLELYHGTSYKNFLKIKTEQHFYWTPRKDHWLGNGTYFFINDKKEANWWANTKFKSKQQTCVIFYPLNIESKNLLDLNSNSGSQELNTFFNDMRKLKLHLKLSKSENDFIKEYPFKERKNLEKKFLRSKLLNMYIKYNTNIKAICYAFDSHINHRVSNMIGIHPKQNQLNLIDQSLINFNKLICVNI